MADDTDTLDVDVLVCWREGPSRHAAETVLADLRARGFVVHGDAPVPEHNEARAHALAEAPDFVLVVEASTFVGTDAPDDPLRRELAHTLAARRVVVPLLLPGAAMPAPESLPPDIRAVTRRPTFVLDPAAPAAGLSALSHTLSSDAAVDDRRLMRRARWVATIVAAIAVGVVVMLVAPPVLRWARRPMPPSPVPGFALVWAGAVERAADGTVSALGDGTVVSRGDRLRLAFAPVADGFTYVVVRYADGVVDVWHPPHTLRGASAVTSGVTYLVPSGAEWLETRADGIPESVSLVGSYDPIENLEELAESAATAGQVAERLELLTSTLDGLVDGRHGTTRRPTTRKGAPIDTDLPVMAPVLDVRFPGGAGRVASTGATLARGVVSVNVTLALQPR